MTDLVGSIGGFGSSALGYILPFLFVLTIVVFFHELGHFLVARWCGVHVRVFSVGFGPELFGFDDRHGTRWKLSAIPLGGYVRFLGDENEASTIDRAAVAAMTPEERARSFPGKGVAARAAIVAAGPIANILLAIAIFASFAFFFGEQQVIPRIGSVEAGSTAEAAGFKPGDVVVSIDGRSIDSYNDVETLVATSTGQALHFVVDRGGQDVNITATPENRSMPDYFGGTQEIGVLDISGPQLPARVAKLDPSGAAAAAGFEVGDVITAIDGKPISNFLDLQKIVVAAPGQQLTFDVDRAGSHIVLKATPASVAKSETDSEQIGRLGIIADYDPADIRQVSFGPIAAVQRGIERTWFVADRTVAYLGGVITGRESTSQIGGPLRVAQIAQQAVSISMETLIGVAGFLSVSIGLLNLLPIPMLDGGHLLYFAFEAVRGRPLSEAVQEIGYRIGLVAVLMLMIFATWNDIVRLATS